MKAHVSYGNPPSLWPKNKAQVIEVAQHWYDPSLVSLVQTNIERLPVGSVKAPESTNLTLRVDASPGALSGSIQYAIALNAINHMFWSLDEEGRFQRYERDGKVGALLMTDCFKAAWLDPESPLQNVKSGTPLTVKDIESMFGNIPDPQGRAEVLNEVLGSDKLAALSNRWADAEQNNGCFDTAMAAELAQAFPRAYSDALLKKSQLAVSSVWRTVQEHGQQARCDLTAFADYQVPNVLRAMGLLEYSPELAAQIDAQQLIAEDSKEERAIRAASILAVESLARVQQVAVADVDFWLWLKRKEPKTPFHLTLTNAY